MCLMLTCCPFGQGYVMLFFLFQTCIHIRIYEHETFNFILLRACIHELAADGEE